MKYDINKQTVKWFVTLHQQGNLLVNHDYQRRGVWLYKDRIKLVESVLLDLPIPEIYIWQRDTNPVNGETQYEIVDGQQRISSIIDFITNPNMIMDAKYLDKPDSDFADKNFEELSPEDKQAIWKYSFVVRVIDSSESKENIVQMFLRLNRTNLSLNPQELRNAEFNGEFIRLSLELSQLDFWKKYNIFSNNDIRRMLDVQFTSSILIFLRNGIQSETQAIINKMYDRYNDCYEEKEDDRVTFIRMVEIVEQFLAADSSFAQKKSHLFTLFNLAYMFINDGIKLQQEHIENYRIFSLLYNFNDEQLELVGADYERLERDLAEYRSYAVEGIAKKFHREQRFYILKNYVLKGFEEIDIRQLMEFQNHQN